MLVDYLETSKKIENFVDFFCYSICASGCFSKSSELRSAFLGHHKGALLQLFANGEEDIEDRHIDKWLLDTEHGFLHGFLVCFFSFYLSNQKLPSHIFHYSKKNDPVTKEESLIASCLLHDFLRPIGIDNKHDAKLRSFFNGLDEATYTHSNPPDEWHPLVMGDRIELMRYADHCNWIDRGVIERYMDKEMHRITKVIYEIIRPALVKIIEGRNEIWIRHSPEDIIKSKLSQQESLEIFPSYYWRQESEFWPIEIGSLPFKHCILHGNGHDPLEYNPYGMITMGDLRKYGYKMSSTPSRDHLSVKSDIPLKEWIFVIDNSEKNLRKLELAWGLMEKGRGVISLGLANKFHEIGTQISIILKALRS